jgi:hypothetical protein
VALLLGICIIFKTTLEPIVLLVANRAGGRVEPDAKYARHAKITVNSIMPLVWCIHCGKEEIVGRGKKANVLVLCI